MQIVVQTDFRGRKAGFVYLMRNSVDFFPQSSTKFFNLIFVPFGYCHREEVCAIGSVPARRVRLREEVCGIGESFCCGGSCNFVLW